MLHRTRMLRREISYELIFHTCIPFHVLPGLARHEAQLSLEAFGNVLASTRRDKMCD
jgi:hypothetical protein